MTVAETNQSHFTCAHDFWMRVVENLRWKHVAKSQEDKRRAARGGPLVRKNFDQQFLSPLKALEQLHAACNALNTTKRRTKESARADVGMQIDPDVILIVVHRAECLNSALFDQVVQSLQDSSLKFCFLLLHSDHCALDWLSTQTLQANTTLSLIKTMTSMDVYDALLARLLAAREIPVTFPLSVVGWMHESFHRSTRCVKSTVEK